LLKLVQACISSKKFYACLLMCVVSSVNRESLREVEIHVRALEYELDICQATVREVQDAQYASEVKCTEATQLRRVKHDTAVKKVVESSHLKGTMKLSWRIPSVGPVVSSSFVVAALWYIHVFFNINAQVSLHCLKF
jgi:hypothetical protein